MTTVDVREAKTQFQRLLNRVGRGERFVITKRGRPIAKLIPAATEGRPDVKKIIREMEKWQEREGPTLGPDLTIRQLREEGRRF